LAICGHVWSDLVLQQSSDLTVLESWAANTAPVTDDGTNKSVTVPATNSLQFFRLRSPQPETRCVQSQGFYDPRALRLCALALIFPQRQ
jgi:hypothetical protein